MPTAKQSTCIHIFPKSISSRCCPCALPDVVNPYLWAVHIPYCPNHFHPGQGHRSLFPSPFPEKHKMSYEMFPYPVANNKAREGCRCHIMMWNSIPQIYYASGGGSALSLSIIKECVVPPRPPGDRPLSEGPDAPSSCPPWPPSEETLFPTIWEDY